MYLDPTKTTKGSKPKRDKTSTQVLRDLEISLRTNNIEWVREFLSECDGLSTLIEYLTTRLLLMRHELGMISHKMPIISFLVTSI